MTKTVTEALNAPKKGCMVMGRERAFASLYIQVFRCNQTTEQWLTELESHGLTKILIAGGNPATNPAKKFGIFHE